MNDATPFDPKEGQATAEMINAFLRWKLPESVASDPCATRPAKGRTGTNLLSVVEAMAMIQEVVCPIIAKHLAHPPSVKIGDGKDGERFHKVMQTKFGKDGDCFNACLATLLNVPLETLDYFRSEDTWYADLQAWLAPRGLAYVEVDDNKTPTPFYRFPLPVLAIASGPSPRGVEGGHACVVEMTGWDRKIIHDPHPDNTGLEQIKSIGLLVRRSAAMSAQSPQSGREEKSS